MSFDPLLAVAALVLAIIVVPKLLAARRVPLDVVTRKLEAGAVVVDVRSAAEFRGGAYPGAMHIPLGELSSRLGELPRDRPVVLYCASGLRSGTAARLLRRAGFADVVNAGGLHAMPR